MSEFKRLHPLEILIHFISDIKSYFFTFLLLYVWIGSDSLFRYVMLILAFVIINLIVRFVTWSRFVYRITDTELQIEYGLFVRKKSYVSKYRIQSIDITEGVLHRIFGLSEVKIETASKTSSSLKAVEKSTAVEIQKQLKVRNEESNEEDFEETNQIEEQLIAKKTVTNSRLFIAGMTSSGIGVLFAGAWVVFSQLEEFVPEALYAAITSWLGSLGLYIIMVLTFIALVVSWFIGIAMSMIKNGRFTIQLVENELIITKGLIEKKRVTIPLQRIQAIGFRQNLIREPFGFGTLYAEVAGGGLSSDANETLTDLFPIMKKSEINKFLNTFAKEHGEWQENYYQPQKPAYLGYLFRSSGFFALVAIGLFFVSPIAGWIALIPLIVSLVFGHMNYKSTGFYINKNRLYIKQRRISKIMVVIFRKRIQAYAFQQHYFQRRSNIATIKASIISGQGGTSYKLKSMAVKDTEELTDWYRPDGFKNRHDPIE